MVQRTVTNKIGIQSDHVKPEKKLVSHKPSSLDIKNGATDLKKKKMKKSGSIKRPEFNSPNSRKHVKPPPTPPPACGGTITTPNYMRSTTSSDARKEKPQISAKIPPLSSSRKSAKSSKLAVASGCNNNKVSPRTTTSLKMMRIPSFKPVRATVKRRSPVVLCENLDVKRATCSSTLKDRKFPDYLILSPGATEADGTSAMKVCPYTYCSLNGHRHAPVPPLKCFMSVRRRAIKAQRNVKLGCLSPRRVIKPIGDDLNMQGETENRNGITVSPLSQEETSDGFFIEIYSVSKGDEEQDVEKILDGSISSEFDYDQNQDSSETQTATGVHFDGEKHGDESYEDQFNEVISEASDMDWETGDFPSLYLDDEVEVEYASKSDKDGDFEEEGLIMEDEFMIKLDDSIKGCFTEYLSDEVSQESFDEEGFCSDVSSSSDEIDFVGPYDCLENSVHKKTSEPELEPVEETEAVPEDDNNILSEDYPLQISADEDRQIQADEKHLSSDGSQKSDIKNQVQRLIQEVNPETDDNSLSIAIGKRKKPEEELGESGEFNPRDPNFLPLEPDPDEEKVDLRHQELDERKNAEEWMVDYALRQAVTKLAPARKRKVALLVEAFEKVMPVSKCEFHLRHGSGLDHARTIQACS